MPDPRHALGRLGEAAVAGWLSTAGWQVMARRWRGSGGELDIIGLDPANVLVGVEVKLRSSGRAGTGIESVDARRLRRMRLTLVEFAARRTVAARRLRLDLVTLEPAADGRWRARRHQGIDEW